MTALRKRVSDIKKLFSKEQTEILDTAMLAMLPVFLTKVTGQLFYLVAASYFGTNDPSLSNFLIASTIPDLIGNVLIAGALGAVVIPTLIMSKKEKGEEFFLKLYNTIISTYIVIFIILSVVAFIFADTIFTFAFNYLSVSDRVLTSAEIFELSNFMRFMLFPQIIIAISSFISSGLNIYNRYLVPQLAPLFYNIGRLAGIVLLVPLSQVLEKYLLNNHGIQLSGLSTWALVAGVYIASFMHLGIQIPLARRMRLNFSPALINLKDNDVYRYASEIFKVTIPRMFTLASEYFALTINYFLAFSINSLPALNFANSLSLFVPQLFAFTFAYASFTHLSNHFEDGDLKAVETIFIKTFNQIIFLALPFIITLIILRVPVVRLTYGLLPGTNLNLQGTYEIAWVLLWFAVGHIFVCGKWFMYRVFYAAKETTIPFMVSIITFVLTVIFSILFTNLFSHSNTFAISATELDLFNFFVRNDGKAAVGGIAAGMSLAYTIEFLILISIFYLNNVRFNLRRFSKSLLRRLVAGSVMFVLMYLMYKTWDIISFSIPVSAEKGFIGSTTLNLAFLTIITVVTCFMVYYLICLLLRVDDIKILKRFLNPVFRIGGIRIN